MPISEQNKTLPAKGVSNRNKGLEWVIQNGDENGVFYFADDDNTYDSELFTEVIAIFSPPPPSPNSEKEISHNCALFCAFMFWLACFPGKRKQQKSCTPNYVF